MLHLLNKFKLSEPSSCFCQKLFDKLYPKIEFNLENVFTMTLE